MRSIRTVLIFRLVVLFAVLFGAADVTTYLTVAHVLNSNMDSSLLAKAKARSSLVTQEPHLVDVDWQGLSDQLRQQGTPDDFAQVQDEQHKLPDGQKEIAMVLPKSKGDLAWWNFKGPRGDAYRALAMRFRPHPDEDQPPPVGMIIQPCIMVVATNLAVLNATLTRVALVLIAITIVALAISSSCIFFGVRRGLRPLDEFAVTVARVQEDSLDKRFPTDALPDEVSPIADKLNDLLARLEVSFIRERRFSADVSHELRTPLTELRTLAEVMLKQSDLTQDSRSGFKDVLEATLQMEALVTTLLQMVRGERGNLAVISRKTDICQVLKKSWKTYETSARNKKLKVKVILPDQAFIETNEHLLRLVFDNLFSNAVEYTPVEGAIELYVRTADTRTTIVVKNTTQDIGPEDLPHFFERFWRKDRVRSNGRHLGLGLSITQLLCQRLNIDLLVFLETVDSVCFSLTMQSSRLLSGDLTEPSFTSPGDKSVLGPEESQRELTINSNRLKLVK